MLSVGILYGSMAISVPPSLCFVHLCVPDVFLVVCSSIPAPIISVCFLLLCFFYRLLVCCLCLCRVIVCVPLLACLHLLSLCLLISVHKYLVSVFCLQVSHLYFLFASISSFVSLIGFYILSVFICRWGKVRDGGSRELDLYLGLGMSNCLHGVCLCACVCPGFYLLLHVCLSGCYFLFFLCL
mgnify:CR=1 FL=1